jgi:3-hydroxyisobutyrate dehydrogenase
METIGFIGLGQMGAPMALNLLRAGFSVVVHDLDRTSAHNLFDEGATWADTPADCAAAAGSLITMLPGPKQVAEVLLTDGAAEALGTGDVWIDMSTSTPNAAERVGEVLHARGALRLDAPVSGMVKGATSGTLSIFVGGDPEVLESRREIFEAMGRPENVYHMGPYGAGYVTKLVGNALWFAHVVATAEVLSLGVKAGVDFAALRQSIIDSPHSSSLVEHELMSIIDDDYAESFAIALACKDAALAVDIGRSLQLPLELCGLVEQIYRRARVAYGPDAGAMSPIRLYEDLAGRRFRPALATGDRK